MMSVRTAALVLALSAPLLHSGADGPLVRATARVIDGTTMAPIAGAIVTIGDTAFRTDEHGAFTVDAANTAVVHVRAAGYRRTDVRIRAIAGPGADVPLASFRPKAVYLSVYGVGDSRLRRAALNLVNTTALNALVIDLKGDRGLVPYRSALPLAAEAGAQRVITIGNLPKLVEDLHRGGIYVIARIVVFKDTLLATARPALAVHNRDGSLFRDREGLAWTNPFSHDVWDYNIGIAREAAAAGIDEIQFDYARLPDAPGLGYGVAWTEQNREAAIDGFLASARHALVAFNVFLAVDVFGYVCWNPDDTKIGQKLERVSDLVDYVSPMLYPSSFQFGIPGYRNPVAHPREIVALSLAKARSRTELPGVRFRPWLQAFRDYAFDGRPFTAQQVRAQIEAAEEFGADGWMLWNPHNEYSATDLVP